jgi:hypothetical protein
MSRLTSSVSAMRSALFRSTFVRPNMRRTRARTAGSTVRIHSPGWLRFAQEGDLYW